MTTDYTERLRRKRGETYPRAVLVKEAAGRYRLETMEIVEGPLGFSVRFGWTTYATFRTLDEAARWTIAALDVHFNRSPADA